MRCDAEIEKRSGPFEKTRRQILVFSAGASNESHGAALPSNIDDFIAVATATAVSRDLGLTYIGHIPYCSDRAGAVAKDWNPSYIPRERMKKLMIGNIKPVLRTQTSLGNIPSHVVVISGHGGNNFLEREEASITKLLSVNFHYIPPFPNSISVGSKKLGRIMVTHADDGEHSVALYLGLLDQKKLLKINKLARKDPIAVLRKSPALMGLGYYILPELGGKRYEDLRKRHPELLATAEKFVHRDRKIRADFDVGSRLMKRNIAEVEREITQFVK